MQRSSTIKPIARALSIIMAVVIIATGATYAALQSQDNLLTGNTIQTATANLKISRDGQTFSTSQPGFSFTDLIPGGQASPAVGFKTYLSNAGGTPLSLKVAVSSTPTNPDNIDLAKVNVVFISSTIQSFTLAQLIAAQSTGGVSLDKTLAVGNTQLYSIQVSMAADAVTGPGTTLGNIDISFSGQAAN